MKNPFYKSFLLIIIALVLIPVSAFSQFGLDKKVPSCELKVPEEISMPIKGKALFSVELIVPPHHHVYLEHLNPEGFSILTEFSLIDPKGISLEKVAIPKGEEYEGELILKNSGTFELSLKLETPRKQGAVEKLALQLRYQLCDDKTGLCYAPVNLKSVINLRFTAVSPSPQLK